MVARVGDDELMPLGVPSDADRILKARLPRRPLRVANLELPDDRAVRARAADDLAVARPAREPEVELVEEVDREEAVALGEEVAVIDEVLGGEERVIELDEAELVAARIDASTSASRWGA